MKSISEHINPWRRLLARVLGQRPVITPDIKEWVAQNGEGSTIGLIGDDTSIERTLPEGVEDWNEALRSLFASNQTYNSYQRAVFLLQDASLNGVEGFVKLRDGSYLLQTAWYPQQITLHPDYYQRRQKPVVEKHGHYFSLILYWSKQYYHWLTENLPLLHGLKKLLPSDTKFIIPGPPSNFHLQTLELLDIKHEQCVPYDGTENWKLERLFFAPPATTSFFSLSDEEIYAHRYRVFHPTHFNGPFNHSPEAIQWLGSAMVNAAGRQSARTQNIQRRVYISRSKAICRKIKNASAFEALLSTYRFKTYYMEELSFKDQVSLFQEADIVVGPHGAGLSNIMFCRTGTCIIEIFDPSVVRLCYWSLSNIMQLQYFPYIGQSRQGVLGLDANIFVDIPDFQVFLHRVVAASPSSS